MKVEIIASIKDKYKHDREIREEFIQDINDFIKDKKVIDIKYTTIEWEYGIYYTAMVIYK